jgi:hypothetical protein
MNLALYHQGVYLIVGFPRGLKNSINKESENIVCSEMGFGAERGTPLEKSLTPKFNSAVERLSNFF